MTTIVVRFGAGLAILVVLVLIAGATSANSHATAPTNLQSSQAPLAAISIKTVTVGTDPNIAVYDPTNKEVYVGNVGSNTVSAVNSTTYAVTTISSEKDPLLLTYSTAGKDVYVENYETKNISVISSANKVVHTVLLPGTVFTQVYDPGNGNVYAQSITSKGVWELSEINHTTFALKNLVLPSDAIFSAYDTASSSLVLSLPALNEVVAVSATDVATTIKLATGLSPEWMVYNPDDKDLYITDTGSLTSKTGNVSVLSAANKVIATVKVGKFPTFGTYDPSNHDIYVVNTGGVTKPYPTGTVSVISTADKVLTTVTVGKYAAYASYDPKNTEIYISCAGSNLTYAISSSTNKVVATITTGQNSIASLYDPGLGDSLAVGVTNFGGGSSSAKTLVTVIPSSNTGTSTLTLGVGPAGGLAYDPTDSGFWVINEGGKSVSVIL